MPAALASPLEYAFFGLGLLATIAVTIVVTRIARKALKQTGAGKSAKQ